MCALQLIAAVLRTSDEANTRLCMASQSPTENRRYALLLLLGALVAGLAFCWLAPAVLDQYRDASWSWIAFRVVHAVSFLFLAGAAVWRGSLHQRVICLIVVAVLWGYVYFFVWVNTWGT